MKYLKTYENNKYKDIFEEEFIDILNNKCKNFSFNNETLYRGDKEKFDFGLHNPIDRTPSYDMMTYDDFFKDRGKNIVKYPVIREKSAIGLSGGDEEEMIMVCKKIGQGKVYRVIPFDNSKLIFTPIFDLIALEHFDIKLEDDDFLMLEYTKNFKVPVNVLKKIQDRLISNITDKLSKLKFVGNKSILEKGFEFFMSSPCLLIPYEKDEWLKSIHK